MKFYLLFLALLFPLSTTFAQAPANDECDMPAPMTVETGSALEYTSDLTNATASLQTGSCELVAVNDVWYQFTMPVDGNVRITGIFINEYFTLFTSCDETTEISCIRDDGFFYNLDVGTTYVLKYAIASGSAAVESFSIQAFAAETNDECDDRQTIAVETASANNYTAELRGATPSAQSGSCEAASLNDVWYQFTMPVDGNVRITDVFVQEYFTLFSSCDETTEISCIRDDGYFYNLDAGTIYVLKYAIGSGVALSESFNIQAFATETNDECVGRQTIAVETASANNYTAELRGATPSAQSGSCEAASLNDVWYQFTMPVDGNVRITNVFVQEYFTLFSSCDETTEISCIRDDGYFYNLDAGTTYVLKYAIASGVALSESFNIQAFATEANDECVGRQTIAVETASANNYTAELRGATPSAQSGSCEAASINDVWYQFTMPVDGNVRITNVFVQEYFTLFTSCDETTEISCIQDDGFFYNLEVGTTYVLKYAIASGAALSESFNIQAFEQIENDTCEDAMPVAVSETTPTNITQDLRGAIESMDTSCDSQNQDNLDAWYAFTMPVDGNIQISGATSVNSFALFFDCESEEVSCLNSNGIFSNIPAGSGILLQAAETTFSDLLLDFNITIIAAPLSDCAATTEFINGDWNNGPPDINTNAIIRSNYNTEDDGSFSACTLAIDMGITLRIEPETYVEVLSNITVDGNLTIEHQGSLVQIASSSLVTNNGNINVNVTTPTLAPRDFMMMGSPMSAETRDNLVVGVGSGVWDDSFGVFNHNTDDFFPNQDVTDAFPDAENFVDDTGNDFSQFTGTIIPGEGYLVRPQPSLLEGNSTYNHTHSQGILNNGDITYNVGFNGDKLSSFNLLANPYPSPILANDFINGNPMVDEIYFWEHITPPSGDFPGWNDVNFTMEDISMYNLMGGIAATTDVSGIDTEPNGIISTAQGFAIKASEGGTATFTNQMRRLTGNTTLRGLEQNTDRLWLSVTSETYGFINQMLVGFTENATADFDAGYDSKRIPTTVSLFSHLENETGELAIQSRETFDTNISIPVGFSTQIDEQTIYTISIERVEGISFENIDVYLLDTLTNETINVSKGSYSFTAMKGQYAQRFLIFFEEGALNTNRATVASLQLFPNPAQNSFFIANPNEIFIDGIVIYDMMGRQVLSQQGIDDAQGINISSLQTGNYIVKISSGTDEVLKRIIKK